MCAYCAMQVSFLQWGNSPLFIVGNYSLQGLRKLHFYGVGFSGFVLCPCYFQQSSTGHFLSVRSLFDVGSSAKSKSKSSPSNDKSRSSNRPSMSGRSKEKSSSITASPPLPPVPHLFPFSTVLRQFLGVRSWFVRGSTPFCDSENTCLSRCRMGADSSSTQGHQPGLPLDLVFFQPLVSPTVMYTFSLCVSSSLYVSS